MSSMATINEIVWNAEKLGFCRKVNAYVYVDGIVSNTLTNTHLQRVAWFIYFNSTQFNSDSIRFDWIEFQRKQQPNRENNVINNIIP